MKVVATVSNIYQEQKQINDRLKELVDTIFLNVKKSRWHYESRIKSEESFALKIETGRILKPSELEDFFACTIVVENFNEIKNAIAVINEHVELQYQRPKEINFTHKDSSSFIFDDLRLYVKLKPTDARPLGPINNIIFEIQIKTFLQHAWGIATHDLIYKGKEINWPKERVAYQIKALLEQAEISISAVANLIDLPEMPKDNHYTKDLKEILAFYTDFFDEVDLPKDLIRLCSNTKELLKNISIPLSDLRAVLTDENNSGRGVKTKSLSPYTLIIQSLINQRKDLINSFIHSKNKKFRLVLTSEMQLTGIKINPKTVLDITINEKKAKSVLHPPLVTYIPAKIDTDIFFI